MLLDVEVEQALGIVLGSVSPLAREIRPLLDCLGSVLAEEVPADMDIPPFDNSAMDGYAVMAADTAGATPEKPVSLRVIADLPAGYPPHALVRSGEAVRIMTGAPMPSGTDAVVRTEEVERGDWTVLISKPVPSGNDLRRAGEDVRKGEVILRQGIPLRPAEIGMLATLGRTRAQVVRTPRVAVLATGDELVAPDEPVTPGKIRNSNLYSISAQVKACGGEPLPLGVARDTAAELEARIRQGIIGADMLLTSVDGKSSPLFAFGYGLSYTTFKFSNLKIIPPPAGSHKDVLVSFKVENTGKLAGDEVAQVYMREKYASVERPVEALKGFKRVHLLPGQSTEVTIKVRQSELALWGANKKWDIEPGEFTVKVGASSQGVLSGKFDLK